MNGPQISAIAVTGGGSLSLASLALPVRALATALAGLSGAGSRVALEAVAGVEHPEWEALTGTIVSGAPGEAWVVSPSISDATCPTFDCPDCSLVVDGGTAVLIGCTIPAEVRSALVLVHLVVSRSRSSDLPPVISDL
eukprot:SAG22_NODE_503_length_9694_cov_13.573736_3_plen_138_part_00